MVRPRMRWFQLFVDRVTGRMKGDGASGLRRRDHIRHALALRVTLRCASWPNFREAWTGELSDAGLSIEIDAPAIVGEAIELSVAHPDGRYLTLEGTVASVAPKVLGVKLAALAGEAA